MELIKLVKFSIFIHCASCLAVPPNDHAKISGKVFFYGADEGNPDEAICAVGEVLSEDGICTPAKEATRDWSFYAANQKEDGQKRSFRAKVTHRPKMKYDIVVIHSNDKKNDEPPPIIVPPPAEKTVVVVVEKGPKDKSPRIIEASTLPPLSPEVHFIDYKPGTNMLLPGGIDLKTALSGSQFIANRIKSGSADSKIIAKDNQVISEKPMVSYPGENVEMRANFERFVRSNINQSNNKSFKDLVYDYILETGSADDDDAVDDEENDLKEFDGQKTNVVKLRLRTDQLSSVKNIAENYDVNRKIEKSNAYATKLQATVDPKLNTTSRMTSNEAIREGTVTIRNYVGEALTSEFASVWKGITSSSLGQVETTTENSVNLPTIDMVRPRPPAYIDMLKVQTSDEKIVTPFPKNKMNNLEKEDHPDDRNIDSANQHFYYQNTNLPVTVNIEQGKYTSSHSSHNQNLSVDATVLRNQLDRNFLETPIMPSTDGPFSRAESNGSTKLKPINNTLTKPNKIVPEIESFFRKLFNGTYSGSNTEKFDYIITEMAKIVAESHLFKIHLQNLKKGSSEETDSGSKIEKGDVISPDTNIPNVSNLTPNILENSNSALEQTKLGNTLKKKSMNGQGFKMLNQQVNEKQEISNIKTRFGLSNLHSEKSNESSENIFRVVRVGADIQMTDQGAMANQLGSPGHISSSYNERARNISKASHDGWKGMGLPRNNAQTQNDETPRSFSKLANNFSKHKFNTSRSINNMTLETVGNYKGFNKSSFEINNTKEYYINNSSNVINQLEGNSAKVVRSSNYFQTPMIEVGRSHSVPYNRPISLRNAIRNQSSKKEKVESAKISNGSQLQYENNSDSTEIKNIRGRTTFDHQVIKEADSDVRSSNSNEQFEKVVKPAIGNIVYGKQFDKDSIDEPKMQVSSHHVEDDTIQTSHNTKSNHLQNNGTQINYVTELSDDPLYNGLKSIIDKIIDGKPFEKIPKVVPSDENPEEKNTHKFQDKMEVTTDNKTLEKNLKTNRKANLQITPYHKTVTTSLGINITDPLSFNAAVVHEAKVDASRLRYEGPGEIIRSQNGKVSQIELVENRLEKVENVASKSSAINNQFLNNNISKTEGTSSDKKDVTFKNFIDIKPELTQNGNKSGNGTKRHRTTTKFTLSEVKPYPYGRVQKQKASIEELKTSAELDGLSSSQSKTNLEASDISDQQREPFSMSKSFAEFSSESRKNKDDSHNLKGLEASGQTRENYSIDQNSVAGMMNNSGLPAWPNNDKNGWSTVERESWSSTNNYEPITTLSQDYKTNESRPRNIEKPLNPSLKKNPFPGSLPQDQEPSTIPEKTSRKSNMTDSMSGKANGRTWITAAIRL